MRRNQKYKARRCTRRLRGVERALRPPHRLLIMYDVPWDDRFKTPYRLVADAVVTCSKLTITQKT